MPTKLTKTETNISNDARRLRYLRMVDKESKRFNYVAIKECERVKPRELFGENIISIERNESVVTIRTLPARALGVAEFLNACGNDDIFGAIGQSSVVVVYPKAKDRMDAIIKFLRE